MNVKHWKRALMDVCVEGIKSSLSLPPDAKVTRIRPSDSLTQALIVVTPPQGPDVYLQLRITELK